jgi:beta-N-acetylhexosaminidase
MPRARIALLLASVLLAGPATLAGCVAAPATPSPSSGGPMMGATPPADPALGATDLVRQLTDEDLVGQVLMPYAYGDDANKVSAGSAAGNQKLAGVDTPAQMVAKYRLGGLILVSYSADDPTATTNPTTNVSSAAQVAKLTSGLQAAAGRLPARVPLLIGTDQEYGAVTRIKSGVTQLPSAMTFGAAGKLELTQAAWAAAGADLAAIGLNVDFAPDADVLGAAGNPAIGSRSYGQRPTAVSEQVAAAVRGLHSAGVAATLKHFPGHGHTSTDSHNDLPVLAQSRSALDSGDLPPFAAGIAAGAQLVMSGHLDVRSIDPGVPASFSSKVLVDLLRKQMGFRGVVVTDALNMAPAQKWPPAEAARRALLAGNDILLMPPDLPGVSAGLLAALHSGELPRARLVEAVTRILTLKLTLAARPQPSGLSNVGSQERQATAAAVAAAAVTVLRGSCARALVTGPVTVTTSDGRDTQRGWLTEALRAQGVTVVDQGGSEVHLVGYGDAAADLSTGAEVTVAMDTPYILGKSSSPVRVATYSSTRVAMQALAAVLAGKAKPAGRSPVDVPGLPRSAC